MTPRHTRSYVLWFPFWPLWHHWTRYDKPVNLLLFRWFDFLPLALVLAFVPVTAPEWVPAVVAAWYFGVFPLLVIWRAHRRAHWCEKHGHTPYRPIPEVDEWECAYCATPLDMSSPQFVATSVAAAASEVNLARRGQAFYSDRR
jgi:hypothetical protein